MVKFSLKWSQTQSWNRCCLTGSPSLQRHCDPSLALSTACDSSAYTSFFFGCNSNNNKLWHFFVSLCLFGAWFCLGCSPLPWHSSGQPLCFLILTTKTGFTLPPKLGKWHLSSTVYSLHFATAVCLKCQVPRKPELSISCLSTACQVLSISLWFWNALAFAIWVRKVFQSQATNCFCE